MKTLIVSLKIFLLFTVLTGMVYPLMVTGIAQVLFPAKANGSIVYRNNIAVGSELIGQQFDSPEYFTSRPSAVSYNPMPSGGTNYGPGNALLKKLVYERKKQFIVFNQLKADSEVPAEMLFASASGLDPHISYNSALLQAERISKARSFDSVQKQELLNYIIDTTEPPQYLLFGEERVNVFLLNLKIDCIK